jgi:SulP family sulfate permease
MVEKPAIAILLRSGRAEAAVLAVTFGLTIFRDLTEAIVAGFLLGSVLFIHRMSLSAAITTERPFVTEDRADSGLAYDAAQAANRDVVIHHISGALFFGAAASVGSVLDHIGDAHRALILNLEGVPFLDSTGANLIEGVAHKAHKRGVALVLAGAPPEVRAALDRHGLDHLSHAPDVQAALRSLRPAVA